MKMTQPVKCRFKEHPDPNYKCPLFNEPRYEGKEAQQLCTSDEETCDMAKELETRMTLQIESARFLGFPQQTS